MVEGTKKWEKRAACQSKIKHSNTLLTSTHTHTRILSRCHWLGSPGGCRPMESSHHAHIRVAAREGRPGFTAHICAESHAQMWHTDRPLRGKCVRWVSEPAKGASRPCWGCCGRGPVSFHFPRCSAWTAPVFFFPSFIPPSGRGDFRSHLFLSPRPAFNLCFCTMSVKKGGCVCRKLLSPQIWDLSTLPTCYMQCFQFMQRGF